MTDHSYPSNGEPRASDASALDTVFALLSDPRRRYIVTQLLDAEARPVEAFVRSSDRVDSRTEEIALHHTHLPKLHGASVVDWDRDAAVVRRGPRFEDVEAVVELLLSNRDALPCGWP